MAGIGRHVLVIAYYFPPMGLSGVQRVAKMVRYLPAFGWQPVVLSVTPGGYFAYDASLLEEVEAAGVQVYRTGSVDPTRLFGRERTVRIPPEHRRRRLAWLSHLLFVPDNKVGWYPWAVRAGRRLLRRYPFDAILSSAPPYTAHLVARSLSRASGLPLVTDYRDDWVGNPRHVYPTPMHRRLNVWLEQGVCRASRIVTTINEPIRAALASRNAHVIGSDRIRIVPQGFDPADFEGAVPEASSGRMRLVYSGTFYDVQTPDYFLKALARFLERRPEFHDRVEAVFVGTVPDASRSLAANLGLNGCVRFAGYVPHGEAVAHLRGADVLWLTVGRRDGAEGISTSKLFEYMGARKPILALVPPGAARDALEPYGAAYFTPPDDVDAIARRLEQLAESWCAGTLPQPDDAYVRRFDRRQIAGLWADLLNEAAGV